MKREAQLTTYKVTLTALTPVCVSSGGRLGKYEYAFDQKNNIIRVIDMNAFMKAIFDHGLTGEYERLVLNDSYNDGLSGLLAAFFDSDEIEGMTQYQCHANIYDNYQRLMEIIPFMRDSLNRPYIAGSSLKGALRTVLLANRIAKDSRFASDTIEHMYDNVENDAKKERQAEGRAADLIESKYFNTLGNDRKIHNAVNSIMRTVSVSDSLPLSYSDITLCKKIDIGISGVMNYINLLRECIKPSTTVTFTLTLDNGEKSIKIDEIKSALSMFSGYYDSFVKTKFNYPPNALKPDYKGKLLLGGGVGYFSKTVMYNAANYDMALKSAAYIMSREFPMHKHGINFERVLSPHMIKYTEYNNCLMPMGVCDIKFD